MSTVSCALAALSISHLVVLWPGWIRNSSVVHALIFTRKKKAEEIEHRLLPPHSRVQWEEPLLIVPLLNPSVALTLFLVEHVEKR